MDWQSFKDGLPAGGYADNGRPSCPVRLMVVLPDLKYANRVNVEVIINERLAGYFSPVEFILSMNG